MAQSEWAFTDFAIQKVVKMIAARSGSFMCGRRKMASGKFQE